MTSWSRNVGLLDSLTFYYSFILRDRMAELTGEEVNSAMNELERKEAFEAKRQQSLANKLRDELE
jgi:hypothetical protein